MYETCFNLSVRPFASVPRIDHYYPAAVIENAKNSLVRCIDRGEGVALIIGPSGTGKSLLCQVVAEYFSRKLQVALLAGAHLDSRRTLLQAILYELNRPYRGMDEGELRLSLVDYITLDDDCAGGLVLLVDEAHHLPLRLLDEIRSLTNLVRAMQPAVRVALAGNHVLEERFASPKLESFSQRVAARCYLEAFQRDETQAYIWTRLSACGCRGDDIFSVEACQTVHKATDGVPRLVNQVCDHVLLLTHAAGLRRVEPAHIEEAWADLQQLPTPWNGQTPAASDNVIEFGGLDDAPSERPSIAGRIRGDEADSVEMQPGADEEASSQLRHIQQLLADVQAEFLPAGSGKPEVELVFEPPRLFEETFADEEVIADRYAAASAIRRETLPGADGPLAAAQGAVAVEEDRMASAPAVSPSTDETTAAEAAPARRPRRAPQRETIPLAEADRPSHGDKPELDAAPASVALHAEEPHRRPGRVPPARPEFGRLFARLRRGL